MQLTQLQRGKYNKMGRVLKVIKYDLKRTSIIYLIKTISSIALKEFENNGNIIKLTITPCIKENEKDKI